LLGALYLQIQGSTNAPKIRPSVAQSSDVTYKSWKITWAKQSFTAKLSYQLFLDPGLVDPQGYAMQLFARYVYSMVDTACSGHGDFEGGYCFCYQGYAGPQCDTCYTGYEDTGSGCQRICNCGCDPLHTSSCVPLGTCDGSGICKCPINYGGDHCEKCATGYENYNAGCTAVKKCDCARGSCDQTSQTCICPDHWDGAKCDACTKGWTGDSCDKETTPDQPPDTVDPSWASKLKVFRILGILLGVIVVVGTAAFFVYKRFVRRKLQPYTAVFDDLEESTGATELEENDIENLPTLTDLTDQKEDVIESPNGEDSSKKIFSLE